MVLNDTYRLRMVEIPSISGDRNGDDLGMSMAFGLPLVYHNHRNYRNCQSTEPCHHPHAARLQACTTYIHTAGRGTLHRH